MCGFAFFGHQAKCYPSFSINFSPFACILLTLRHTSSSPPSYSSLKVTILPPTSCHAHRCGLSLSSCCHTWLIYLYAHSPLQHYSIFRWRQNGVAASIFMPLVGSSCVSENYRLSSYTLCACVNGIVFGFVISWPWRIFIAFCPCCVCRIRRTLQRKVTKFQ